MNHREHSVFSLRCSSRLIRRGGWMMNALVVAAAFGHWTPVSTLLLIVPIWANKCFIPLTIAMSRYDVWSLGVVVGHTQHNHLGSVGSILRIWFPAQSGWRRLRPPGCLIGWRVGGGLDLRAGLRSASQKWDPKIGPKNGPKNGVKKWGSKLGPKNESLSSLIWVLIERPPFRGSFLHLVSGPGFVFFSNVGRNARGAVDLRGSLYSAITSLGNTRNCVGRCCRPRINCWFWAPKADSGKNLFSCFCPWRSWRRSWPCLTCG